MDLTITPQTISSTIANYEKITQLNKLIEVNLYFIILLLFFFRENLNLKFLKKFVRIAKNVESIDEKLTSLENEILPTIKHKMNECSKHNYVII